MADARTIAVYNAKADDYARMVDAGGPDQTLRDFIAALPEGARVLDLGCGPGGASEHMRAAGLDPDPVDASPAMIALAKERFGLDARIGTFDEIAGEAIYDGVWANFSLLHAARADLPRLFAALARALRPGGLFHVGLKTGTGEARDAIDRLYTYVTVEDLHRLFADAGLAVLSTREGSETGLAGTDDPFVLCLARKPADA
jgi:SAM-dependent methyltransferase